MDQKTLVKEVCEACGFTQQDLADVLKVSKNTVARWARNELPASAPIIARLEGMAKSVGEKSSADSEILDRWHMIKGAADLQRFANHIARFEFWPEHTFSSNPYSGSDEGWDGGTSDGTILIQAKFSNEGRAKGFKYIKSSFADEYEQALANKKIKKYILATNLDLLPSQCDLLRGYKTSKGPEIIIWNKETLTLRAKEHKWVLFHYFHYPQLPRFLPGFIYLQEVQPKTECIGFERHLEELLAFCKSDDCLLVVKGGTHVGKSRLLVEFVKLLSKELTDVKPWVLRSEFPRRCSETIEDEINISHGKHIILLDDAHLHGEDVEDLTEYSHAAKNNLKAIVFTNSSALPLIQKSIKKRGPRQYKVLEITRLDRKQLEQVFLNASGGYRPDRLDRVVKNLDSDLFLISEIGTKLKSRTGEVNVIDVLKDVKVDLIRQSSESLELSAKQADQLLTELSLVAPFPDLNTSEYANKIHTQIAKFCDLEQEDYQRCLRRLSSGEIIGKVGNYFSFKSKWIGYFFLRQKILDLDNPQFCEKALGRWIEVAPSRVLANIATAGFDEGSGPVTKILKDLVITWTKEAETTTPTKRRHRLELLRGICSIMPSQVLALIQQYVEIPSKVFEQDLIKWGLEERNPDLDDIGPLIQEVGKISEYAISSLELLASIRPRGLRHFYGNYAVPELVRQITQSQLVDTGTVRQILEYEVENDLGFFLESFKIVMASVLDAHDSFETTITISPVIVPAIPQVIETRLYALKLALHVFSRAPCEDSITHEFVRAMGNVGERLNHIPIRGELPLAKTVLSEKKLILDALEARIPTITNISVGDFRVLAEIELLLLRWWCEGSFELEQIERLLSGFPRSSLYLAFRCYERPEEIVFDFQVVLSKATKKNRRMWLLRNGSSWTAEMNFYRPLTQIIFKEFASDEAIVNFFLDLSGLITGTCNSDPLLIETICDEKPGFADYVMSSPSFEKLNIKIQSAIKKVIALGSVEYIKNWASSIVERDLEIAGDEIFRFLVTLMNSKLDEAERFALISPMCDCKNDLIRRDVAFRCSAIFRQDKGLLLKIVEKLNGLENWNLHHQISFILLQVAEDGIEIPSSLRRKLMKQLELVPKLEHDHQQILNVVCTDFETLISFLKFRFKQDLKENKDYESIPFEGIQCASKFICSKEHAEEILRLGFKVEKESRYILRYRVEYLLKSVPFSSLTAESAGSSYLEESIESKLTSSNYSEAHAEIWWRIRMVRVSELNEQLFVTALERADQHNQIEDVKSDFYSCLTETTWCGSIGSAPSHLVIAKERISSMIKKTKKPRVIAFLEKFLDGIESEIEWHIKRDQDFVANH